MKTMPNIEKYRFGKMVIDSKPVTSDLIILPNGKILNNWRRKKGHYLDFQDLIPIVDDCPDLLIVGTGAFGMMKIDPELKETLIDISKNKEFNIIGLKTAKAMDEYSKYVKAGVKLGACFHLTC